MKIILKKSLEKLCFLELVNDDMQPQKGRLIYIYWYITIKTLLTFIIKNQWILSLIILLWYRSKFYSHLIPKEYLLYPKWREDNRSLPNFIGQLIESQQWYSNPWVRLLRKTKTLIPWKSFDQLQAQDHKFKCAWTLAHFDECWNLIKNFEVPHIASPKQLILQLCKMSRDQVFYQRKLYRSR